MPTNEIIYIQVISLLSVKNIPMYISVQQERQFVFEGMMEYYYTTDIANMWGF